MTITLRLRIIALLLPLCLSACVDTARLAAEKEDSLISWNSVAVATPEGPIPAALYLKERSAVLLQGVDGIEPVGAGAEARLRFLAKGKPATDPSGGAAAAVSDDGYWLTAAHCVDRGPVVLLLTAGDGTVEAALARVVWAGDVNEPGNDLALLHVPRSIGRPVFPLADRPPEQGAVLCRGSGLGSPALAGGVVTSVGGTTDGRVAWFEHSTPLGPGDSGGPAMLADGRLAGVNVRAALTTSRQRSSAEWMNPAMLRRLIDADQRRAR